MSECVVRMELPKNCLNCDLRYECNAFYAPGKHKPFMKGCMIICQLPENHGRLVDADALCEGLVSNHPVVIYVKNAPTIVPAERREE